MDNNLNNIETPQDDIRKALGCYESNEFKQREEIQKKSLIPTKEYESMNNTESASNPKVSTAHRRKESRHLTIWLIVVIILFSLSLCFLFNANKLVPAGKKINTPNHVITEEQRCVIEDVTISYKDIGDFVSISIQNNSQNVVFYNSHGTYLSNDNTLYQPNLTATNIPKEFFGSEITSNGYTSGNLEFSNIAMKDAKYLVITNININGISQDIVFER